MTTGEESYGLPNFPEDSDASPLQIRILALEASLTWHLQKPDTTEEDMLSFASVIVGYLVERE